jgi:RNA polymerase sigma-32 factor
MFFGLHREQQKLERNGVEADTKQLASALAVKEEHVVAMLEKSGGGEISLDAPRSSGERGSRTIGDSLSDVSALRPDVRVETSEFARRLQVVLKLFGRSLQGRELHIFRQRLVSEEPVSLAHLAVGFGVTRERTRQLEHRLKGQIRDYLKQQLGDALELGGVGA